MKVILVLALVATALAAPSTGKINPSIHKALLSKSRLNILVSFESTAEALSSVSKNGMSHGQRATAVYNALKAHAQRTQSNVLAMLHSSQFFTLKVQSFWISNQVYVQGADASLIKTLAAMDDVKSIDEEITVVLDDPVQSAPSTRAEWGIAKIQAEAAWEVVGDGAGAVVGVIDTGARHTHEAIRDNYRGGSHSWFDPYQNSEEPRDGQGHGTHCTGTIAGQFGIGVAPGAQWISCKGLNDFGMGSTPNLLACGEFMLCPHDSNGNNPDCSQAPHVVSNSWGGPGGQNFYNGVIDAWQTAGIIPVFAAGNSGPTCNSIGSPSDSPSLTISVAATDSNDGIASFSSRGPSAVAGEHKPDIAAPGVDVRSAGFTSDTAYATMSGTSMACPHVAGLVALLKSEDPSIGFEEIRRVLFTTSEQEMTFGTQACGGISQSDFPNHHFGHGRINALAAVQAIARKH